MKVRRIVALVLVTSACSGGSFQLGESSVVAESNASNPTVAHSTTGAFVTWVSTENSESNVMLSVSGGTPVRVNDIPGDAAPHEQAPPQVSVGPEGQVYVLWQNNRVIEGRRFPSSNLRFARSLDNGASFEPAIFVNDDAEGKPASHTFHNLAIAKDGTIYASWIDGRRERGAPSHEEGSAHAANLAHDGHHSPSQAGLLGPDIVIARSLDGGVTFSAGVVVDTDACPCCRTSLAVGPSGEVMVAWRKQFANSVRDIVVARSDDGAQTFGNPVRVHEDGWAYEGCPHAGPSIAIDQSSNVHVGWYTGAPGANGMYYAMSADNGATFGERIPLLADRWVPPSQVKIAAAEVGAWLIWDDRRFEEPTLSIATARGDGTIRSVKRDVISGASPAIANGPLGPTVAWLESGQEVKLSLAP